MRQQTHGVIELGIGLVMELSLGKHPLGIFIELYPGFHQLGSQGNDGLMGGREVGRVILNLVNVINQIEADGVLTSSHQCLWNFIVKVILGKPQGGAHRGGRGTILLDLF